MREAVWQTVNPTITYFTNKIGLFESRKKFQFGTRNYGELHASPVKQWGGNSFIEEKEKLGGPVINKMSIGGNWEFKV